MPGSRTLATAILSSVILLSTVSLADDERNEPRVSVAERDHSFEHVNYRPNEKQYRFLPLTQYINTAFDSAQISRTFSQDDYFENHKDLADRIFHPHSNIKKDGGYNKILEREFASARVLPNVVLHMVGNGYDFRTLAEWYDHRGVPYPFLVAFLTSYAGYVGNEALEISSDDIDGSDHIADLYVFNLLGNLLFINDDFAKFFHDDLQMRNWTGQPIFDVKDGEVLNASNNYVFRPDLFTDDVRPFVYVGLHYFGGLSFSLADRSELSLGAGFAVEDPFNKPTDSFGDNFKKLNPSGGVFWDRDDRLMASMIFNGTNSYLVRANVYPHLFPDEDLDVGFFLGISERGTPSMGITVTKLFALGL